jgi:hypothetical protein
MVLTPYFTKCRLLQLQRQQLIQTPFKSQPDYMSISNPQFQLALNAFLEKIPPIMQSKTIESSQAGFGYSNATCMLSSLPK